MSGNKRFIKILDNEVYYLVDTEKASKTLDDFKNEIAADYINDGYSYDVIEEVALEEYNDYLYEHRMTATENVDLLNELYESKKLFQNIVHGTIEKHITGYNVLLEKPDGIIRGDAVKERIRALQELRNEIYRRWCNEIVKGLPKPPIGNCRCVYDGVEIKKR